jgi:prevent-host-death family protein
MKTASLASVKTKLASLVDKCEREGPVIITRNDKPVAVLLAAPADEDELDRLVLSHSPQFKAMLKRSQKSFDEGKDLSEEEFWTAVEKRAQERKKKATGNRVAKR